MPFLPGNEETVEATLEQTVALPVLKHHEQKLCAQLQWRYEKLLH